MNRSAAEVHLIPEKVTFSLFTSEEIKKMSVTKIVTPLMFDALGHPLPGGLYDKKLGPLSDKMDVCETCYKSMANCPGHFSYIELPLPVVNPLFHKNVGTLLKITCPSCHMIQLHTQIKKVFTIQLRLLNNGLLIPAMEVDGKMTELIAQYGSFDSIPEHCIQSILSDEESFDEAGAGSSDEQASSQHIETFRNQLISNLLRSIKTRKSCLYCSNWINKIQVVKNKIISTGRKEMKKDRSEDTLDVGLESKYINPQQSKQFLREIWKKEQEFIEQLISVLPKVSAEHPTDALFFDVIPVPPPNVRPVNFVQGRVIENKQSMNYRTILQNVILLRAIIQVVQNKGQKDVLNSTQAQAVYNGAKGASPIEKLNNAWEELQNDVNGLVDKESGFTRDGEGLKQILEKKQGIIRMNMMGKRVNFSARSVITPDPNLNIEEIGIPEEFAKRLTYPVPVTPWNVQELRKMITNGPNVHPGAVMVEINGMIKKIDPNNINQKNSLLKSLLTPADKAKKSNNIKIVHRHLCNGDILLLNRQPTLHKPSIMAHTARILKGEKTLRLHYANCKSYNADFDGDEMNVHFAQNELARSEGYNIANVANQYLVPKDGTPLSGLIQDHMISGVRLSLRGRFFTREDYQQLVYQALSFKTVRIKVLPPSIIKPVQLWSGKQVLSTIIINIIPEGKALINLTGTSKIPAKAWQSSQPRIWAAGGTLFENPNTMTEAEVIIRNGELLAGILDKSHYGATPYGFVHCIYELYGGTYATRLLSSFAKLFMSFLQTEGFTLGVKDILVIKKSDKKRKRIIDQSRNCGRETITSVLDLPEDAPIDEIMDKIEKETANDPKFRSIVDRQYKSVLDGYTNDINKTCLPAGLICKFPDNNLQLMVQSGAKGSTVNTMQISCLLGQIELEGKRPPIMISGKSLPSFPAFDFSPRAGGFIDGRFMTGIQPQEFFFHCMAGREGLIDTAVKTSRSGYLQRCLIKHFEGLKVEYDLTVRNSDKSVVQFLYGEDGLDISKSQFFNPKQLGFLSENVKVLSQPENLKLLKSDERQPLVDEHLKKLSEWKTTNGDPLKRSRKGPFAMFSKSVLEKVGRDKITSSKIADLWRELDPSVKNDFLRVCQPCPDPVANVFQPDANFGAVNEKIERMFEDFQPFKKKRAKREFRDLFKLKAMQSMCQPGEPVGLLAAQSIGEPSTQMTLNTFHFAGRGEMNVTLGIPRLREILMTASKEIKTPSMEVPFLPCADLKIKAENLRKLLTRVVVSDVLEDIDVSVKLLLKPTRVHCYTLRFNFLPKKYYTRDYHVKPKQILKHMRTKFFSQMFNAIRKFCKVKSNMVLATMEETKSNKKKQVSEDDDEEVEADATKAAEEQSSEDEIEDEEDAKITKKHQDVQEDQEPEEEERVLSENEYSDDENDAGENGDGSIQDQTVIDNYNFAQDYREDSKHHIWCEITFALPLNFVKLDMSHLLRDVATKSVLWETPNIKRAIILQKNDKTLLKTDGINLGEMFKYCKILDIQQLYCNDIHKMAETYGIEAASRAIVKEVKDVFNVYGITVDPRHLSLIADYMTFNGTFEPLSRKGMESSPSPLQQLSFESSLTFLKNATIRGKQDNLQNPSSCLMLGKPCEVGTGCFSLLHQMKEPVFA